MSISLAPHPMLVRPCAAWRHPGCDTSHLSSPQSVSSHRPGYGPRNRRRTARGPTEDRRAALSLDMPCQGTGDDALVGTGDDALVGTGDDALVGTGDDALVTGDHSSTILRIFQDWGKRAWRPHAR